MVPRSVAYVCIQSVCDVTELEKWRAVAPPVSDATEAPNSFSVPFIALLFLLHM